MSACCSYCGGHSPIRQGQRVYTGSRIWIWWEGARRWGIPAFLVPGVVPFDEPLGALQLGVQAVLLTSVPGHTFGGDAEMRQDGWKIEEPE